MPRQDRLEDMDGRRLIQFLTANGEEEEEINLVLSLDNYVFCELRDHYK